MDVVFRADACLTMGSGHVMRCLTLAAALRQRNVAVSFVCQEHDGHLCGPIEDLGFVVNRLSVDETVVPTESTPGHAAWLRATWRIT